mmetsp:Transcript_20192/g.52571  ORF Transcript_20192/g.52571 Transcript_20192/m.52571 type:complete len:241 (-) Transcript_20192:588-1310(-)
MSSSMMAETRGTAESEPVAHSAKVPSVDTTRPSTRASRPNRSTPCRFTSTSRNKAVAHRSTTACARFWNTFAGGAPLFCSATWPHTRVRDARMPPFSDPGTLAWVVPEPGAFLPPAPALLLAAGGSMGAESAVLFVLRFWGAAALSLALLEELVKKPRAKAGLSLGGSGGKSLGAPPGWDSPMRGAALAGSASSFAAAVRQSKISRRWETSRFGEYSSASRASPLGPGVIAARAARLRAR